MYIAHNSIDSASRCLDRAEETINGLSVFPENGAPFLSAVAELQGMRTKLIIDFPNHIVFYIERECVIEVVRVLGGGQDLEVTIERR